MEKEKEGDRDDRNEPASRLRLARAARPLRPGLARPGLEVDDPKAK